MCAWIAEKRGGLELFRHRPTVHSIVKNMQYYSDYNTMVPCVLEILSLGVPPGQSSGMRVDWGRTAQSLVATC